MTDRHRIAEALTHLRAAATAIHACNMATATAQDYDHLFSYALDGIGQAREYLTTAKARAK